MHILELFLSCRCLLSMGAVASEAVGGAAALRDGRAPLCVGVGNGDYLDIRQPLIGRIQLVSVVAASVVADDPGPIACGRRELQ